MLRQLESIVCVFVCVCVCVCGFNMSTLTLILTAHILLLAQLLVMGLQFHVPRGHGIHAGTKHGTSHSTHQRCLVGHTKSAGMFFSMISPVSSVAVLIDFAHYLVLASFPVVLCRILVR